MAIKWETPAGLLKTITERVAIDIPLVASVGTISYTNDNPEGTLTFSVIAGRLPVGLRLVEIPEVSGLQSTVHIKGSPVEVKRFTTSKFVIRATLTDVDGNFKEVEDRTFEISVDGSDVPEWVTKAGFLNVGPGNAYFVLDNAKVDFQLEVSDPDLTAGDILEFYLAPMGGELPPGLSLTKDGRIVGFTDPVFALEYLENPTGAYDTSAYDYLPIDVAAGGAKSNGFDSYLFDNVYFDYSESSISPRRLSRIYTFAVAVTDGVNTISEIFKIYVVTEEFLQADNTLVQVDTNLFQADSTRDRFPLWITESNLGKIRANNYVTIFLEVYDPPSLPGTITYFLMNTNPGVYQFKSTGEIIKDGRWEISKKYPRYPLTGNFATDPDEWIVITPETVATLPPGLEIDSMTGELAGKVPYQPSISKTYNFTVMAASFTTVLANISYTLLGDWSSKVYYKQDDAVRYEGFIYVCTEANRAVVPGDNNQYWTRGVSSVEKTFTVEIIGEIESSVNWITDSDLGTIKPNQSSVLQVEAESFLYGKKVIYEFVSGNLPPGLDFLPSGIIQGKVKQFADNAGPGLTRFFDVVSSTTDSTQSKSFDVVFDSNLSSFDKVFKFKIKARDSLRVAENIKEFYFKVISDNTKTYANLYVKALQSKEKRLDWYNFITDATTFPIDSIYRYGDKNFGIQTELKVLIYAGIESREAEKFVQAISRNHYRKRLLFGNLKSAKAKNPTTQEVLYEVVYVEVHDDLEKNNKSVQSVIELPDTIHSKVLVSLDSIKVDSGSSPGAINGRADWAYRVSDRDNQRFFPNSIKNMRKRISAVGSNDREFLPLWMRSIQETSAYETGYVKGLVVCYTLPGKSEVIMSKIKASGFDFKTIDFVADRYVIDILDNEIQERYLAFPQRDILNKLANPGPTRSTVEIPIIEDPVPFYPVIDTGQIKNFNTSEEITPPAPAFPFYGQDAQTTGLQQSLILNKNGLIVIDRNTNLQWMRAPNLSLATPAIKDKKTYNQAREYVNTVNNINYSGFSDWRLPTIKELYSLISFNGIAPTSNDNTSIAGLIPFINNEYFIFRYGQPTEGENIVDNQYISSTPFVAGNLLTGGPVIYGVNFSNGTAKGYYTGTLNQQTKFFVQLVRGPRYGINEFVNNGDGTVTDKASQLMWTEGDNSLGLTWQEALNWVRAKNNENYLGYNDWRLPNVKELHSIVDYSNSPDHNGKPSIDITQFTCTEIINENGQPDYPGYWTSTTIVTTNEIGENAAYISFGRALGYDREQNRWYDVNGAGSQRSDPKIPPTGNNPAYQQIDGKWIRQQTGEAVRGLNFVRLVRNV